jgi:hypothetical protein
MADWQVGCTWTAVADTAVQNQRNPNIDAYVKIV